MKETSSFVVDDVIHERDCSSFVVDDVIHERYCSSFIVDDIMKYHSSIGHVRVKCSSHIIMYCARQVRPKGSSHSCLFLT